MSTAGRPSEPGAPAPPAEALARLPSDAWAALLPHVRAALHDLDEGDVTPVIARLRAAPTSQLATGRVRRELCELLAAGGPPWQALRARLAASDRLPDALHGLLTGEPPPAAASDEPATGGRRTAGADTRRLRDRLRTVRDERDAARRRADGAEARASTLERTVEELRQQLEDADRTLADLRDRLAAAGEDRRRAVDRERRRRAAEVTALRDELSALRHAEQERRRADERRRERHDAAGAPVTGAARDRADHDEGPPARLVPGRPSRLPEGVAPGTTEAVTLLLGPGRRVLVDGYNVTRQHRGHLDLDGQRSWLVQLLARVAAQRRVRPLLVFDGQRAAGTRPAAGGREVEVRFTADGITADDELVLEVEATDEPVVVVTDDRDLAARVAASGADVVGTAPFLWAVG